MTTPVVTYQDEKSLITGFYVPSKYDKNSVPKPTSDNVFIEEISNSLFGVIRFKGSWSDKNFDKHDMLLKQYLEEKGYKIISNRFIMRYQPPFIPGMFRRNEIGYKIDSGK